MIEQVLWFLGNITGESEQKRNLIVESTCLLKTFKRLVDSPKISRILLRTVCWVNSNICRYKREQEDSNEIEVCLQVARAGLFTEDSDINSDCIWTVTYITDTNNDAIIDYVAQPDLI